MNEYKQLTEFYPTPPELIGRMLSRVVATDYRYILEPSAGKGDLAKFFQIYYNEWEDKHNIWRWYFKETNDAEVDYKDSKFINKVIELTLNKFLKTQNSEQPNWKYISSNVDVDCVEIDQNLKYILEGKGLRVVDRDFLKFETEKKYDLIIMNPPFSNGDEHLLKAIELQERFGGRIICLLNAETIKNPYSNKRKQLIQLLNKYNAEIEYIEDAFKKAERKTDVEIALIDISIPLKENKTSFIMDELEKEEIELNASPEYEALVTNDYIKAAVIQYRTEIKAGKRLIEEYNALKPMLSTKLSVGDDATSLEKEVAQMPLLRLEIGDNNSSYRYDQVDFNQYVKRVRYKYWYELFHEPKFMSNLTSNLKEEYFAKIKSFSEYDFSLSNIYQMKIDILKQTARGIEEKILELFEKFTYKHSCECDGNIHYFNGWKTNKAYIINKKVVVPWMQTWDDIWKKFQYRYDLASFLIDVEKTLEFLQTEKPTFRRNISHWLSHYEDIQQTKKLEFTYFTINVYKKGTVHITWTDEDLLKKLNIYGCQHKGWLPPSYGKKHYDDMDEEEKAVIDEFEGKESYENVFANKNKYLIENTSSLLMLEA